MSLKGYYNFPLGILYNFNLNYFELNTLLYTKQILQHHLFKHQLALTTKAKVNIGV